MRRVFPWWLLLVAFILVPLAEIYVLIQVGQVIGAWWTIALLIADSIFGAWLVRHEGRRAWQALRLALEDGRMPSRELADGMLILVGGTLLVTPGFLSDVLGMFCILPVTRPLGRRVLSRMITRRLLVASGQFRMGDPMRDPGPSTSGRTTHPRAPRPPGPSSEGPDVVPGEVVD